jgi:hypothetical protein
MSRDKRGNRTQEVVGSSPISSTNPHVIVSLRRRSSSVYQYILTKPDRLSLLS